jgi:hypothetical protein
VNMVFDVDVINAGELGCQRELRHKNRTRQGVCVIFAIIGRSTTRF